MSYQRPQAGTNPSNALFPRGVYTVHPTKSTLGTSQKTGAPMLTIEVEVLAPEVVTDGNGVQVKTAGRKGTMYIVGTEKNLVNLVDLAAVTLGLPLPPQAPTLEDDILAILRTIEGALTPANVFLMNLSASRDLLVDPVTQQPVLDNNGQPIMGRERIDFNSFAILPNTLRAL